MEPDIKEILNGLASENSSDGVFRITKTVTYDILKSTGDTRSAADEQVNSPETSKSEAVEKVSQNETAVVPLIGVKRKMGLENGQFLSTIKWQKRNISDISTLQDFLVAKVLWKCFKITPHQKRRVLEVTFVDEENIQILGEAWEMKAIQLNQTLCLNHIYAIRGIKKVKKKSYHFSRLKKQDFELNIRRLTSFKDVTQEASKEFPQMKYCFTEFDQITESTVCDVIGLVVESNLKTEDLADDKKSIILVNQKAATIEINVSRSFNEIKHFDIVPGNTILAFLGIKSSNKTPEATRINTEQISKVEAFTFQDTVIQLSPQCKETEILLQFIKTMMVVNRCNDILSII